VGRAHGQAQQKTQVGQNHERNAQGQGAENESLTQLGWKRSGNAGLGFGPADGFLPGYLGTVVGKGNSIKTFL